MMISFYGKSENKPRSHTTSATGSSVSTLNRFLSLRETGQGTGTEGGNLDCSMNVVDVQRFFTYTLQRIAAITAVRNSSALLQIGHIQFAT